MILQHRSDTIACITQAEHARVAGELARAWGQEHRVGDWDSMVAATTRHDDGWIDWDAAPSLKPDGSPHDFISCPIDQRIDIYERGLRLVDDEPLAVQELVVLHLVGLFLGRWEPGATRYLDILPPEANASAQAFLRRRDSQILEDGGPTGERLERYRLLQAFDRLSLALTMQPPDEITGMDIHHVPSVGSLTLKPVSPGVIAMDPFMLGEETTVTVAADVLSGAPFRSQEGLQAALAGAEEETSVFTLVRVS